MRPVRERLPALGRAFLAGTGLLFAVEGLASRGRLEASSPWLEPLFEGFGPLDAESGSRIASATSRLSLPGFPAGAAVTLELRASTARRQPFEATLWLNGHWAGAGRVRGVPGRLVAQGVADGAGRVRLSLSGPSSEAAVHVYGLEAAWQRAGWRAPLTCSALLLLTTLLIGWAAATPRAAAALCLIAACALAWALVAARLALLAQAPRLAFGLGAGLLLAAACAAARWPPTWARWFVVALGLRLWLVAQPAFPCIDCASQYHVFQRFQRARILTSWAPGPGAAMVVPYPPAFHAALQPVFGLTGRARGVGPFVVRAAILCLEAVAALLVAAVLLGGGASRSAAAAAAAALACMPEGLLVAAKGIGPNVLGGSAALLVLWALVRPGSGLVLLALAVALALLSHVGAALALGATLVFFLARSAARDAPLARRGLAALAIATGLAWLVYYREVVPVAAGDIQAVRDAATAGGPAGWDLRAVRVGKSLQDLLLKFGGAPLVLAWMGWRRRGRFAALDRGLESWLAVAALAGLAAWLTPFPLRFEYFALPALAILAGLGAEVCELGGGAGRAQAALALALCVQVALGWALVEGRLDPINVILESPRWPLLEQLLALGR